MIEQFLARKEIVPYAFVIIAIVASVSVGFMLGYQPKSTVCAEYIIEAEEQKAKALELNQKLTASEARKAAGSVLDCKRICDEQTKKALDTYKDIICDD